MFMGECSRSSSAAMPAPGSSWNNNTDFAMPVSVIGDEEKKEPVITDDNGHDSNIVSGDDSRNME